MNSVTTVTTATWSYDLTDLPTVKDELSITDTKTDGWLARAISQISKSVGNYCNRVFQPEAIRDQFFLRRWNIDHQTLPGDSRLQLERWPILSVTSVTQTDSGGTVTALVLNTDYEIDAARGQLVRLNSDSGFPMCWAGAEIVVAYVAGYGSEVAEVKSVPGVSPYTVTVAQADAFSIDLGVTGATPGYTVNGSTGTYTFLAADAGKSLTINYAVSDIPDDLIGATLREITGRFWARARDPMLMSRDQPGPGGLGSERFWVPTRDGAFAPEISAILDNYRVPVVG